MVESLKKKKKVRMNPQAPLSSLLLLVPLPSKSFCSLGESNGPVTTAFSSPASYIPAIKVRLLPKTGTHSKQYPAFSPNSLFSLEAEYLRNTSCTYLIQKSIKAGDVGAGGGGALNFFERDKNAR